MKSKPLSTFFRKVADYFDDAKPGRPSRHAVPPSHRMLTRDNFRDRLATFKRHNKLAVDALVTGSVELLGLSEVREQFGDQWDQVKETAQRVVEGTIEDHTSLHDLFLRINDEYYVVLFTQTPQEQAHRKAQMIAQEIARRLYGESPPTQDLVSVRGLAVEFDADVATEKIDTLDQLITYIVAKRHDKEAAQKSEAETLIDSLDLLYRPTVNIPKRLISLYVATLVRQHPVHGRRLGRRAYPPDDTGALRAELDSYTLEKAALRLEDIGGLHHKAALVIPVHFDTLAVKRFRERYIAALKRLGAHTDKHLVLQIFNMPPGIPQGRLRNMLTVIYPFTLGYFCRIALDQIHLYDFEQTGVLGVAIDGQGRTTPDKAWMAQVQTFLKRAWEKDLRTLYFGAHDQNMGTWVANSGFDYINGDAFMAFVPRPGRSYNISGKKRQAVHPARLRRAARARALQRRRG